MQQINIKMATLTDSETLTEIGKATFIEAYGGRNSEEDMQAYIKKNFNQETTNKQLENSGSTFFIAWEGQRAIGYLKLNVEDAQSDLKEKNSIEIERIYVLAQYHGKSIGQLLYQKAVEIAVEQKKESIWLGVWEENSRAIRFYQKNGFETFSTHIFTVGSEEQTDYLMRKKL